MERSKTLLNLTGFRAIRKPALPLYAYCFVALRRVQTPYEWHPRGTPRCCVPRSRKHLAEAERQCLLRFRGI